jgi:hypothetical protein
MTFGKHTIRSQKKSSGKYFGCFANFWERAVHVLAWLLQFVEFLSSHFFERVLISSQAAGHVVVWVRCVTSFNSMCVTSGREDFNHSFTHRQRKISALTNTINQISECSVPLFTVFVELILCRKFKELLWFIRCLLKYDTNNCSPLKPSISGMKQKSEFKRNFTDCSSIISSSSSKCLTEASSERKVRPIQPRVTRSNFRRCVRIAAEVAIPLETSKFFLIFSAIRNFLNNLNIHMSAAAFSAHFKITSSRPF